MGNKKEILADIIGLGFARRAIAMKQGLYNYTGCINDLDNYRTEINTLLDKTPICALLKLLHTNVTL